MIVVSSVGFVYKLKCCARVGSSSNRLLKWVKLGLKQARQLLIECWIVGINFIKVVARLSNWSDDFMRCTFLLSFWFWLEGTKQHFELYLHGVFFTVVPLEGESLQERIIRGYRIENCLRNFSEIVLCEDNFPRIGETFSQSSKGTLTLSLQIF